MLVTAAPLIDIAPLERATMPDRVVVQFDKRDVETLKLIKLDLLGLGMLAAIDETLQLIEHDCAVCLDLDRLPEDVPEVFEMLQAADTVGVFQVESRAQMQTLPKSRPQSLDDLVVEVAIIRPGPIQGNAVHPYLRRKQGLEPVTYLHPEPRADPQGTMGVILYQEQVMRIAIEVAGFSAGRIGRVPAGDGHVALEPRDGEAPPAVRRRLPAPARHDRGDGRGAVPPGRRVRQLRVRQEPRRRLRPDRLRIVVPEAVLPGPVRGRADQRPADGLLPGRGARQRRQAPRRGGPAGRHQRVASTRRRPNGWAGPASRCRTARGSPPGPSRSARRPASSRRAAARERWTPEVTAGWGVRLGLHLVKGIGEQHAALLDAELARGPYRALADVVERTGLPEEVLERLIRAGALDSLGPAAARAAVAAARGRRRVTRPGGRPGAARPGPGGRQAGAAAGRPMDLRLPATDAPDPARASPSRSGSATPTRSSGWMRAGRS